MLSRVWLSVTPWTVAHQAPPSMGFSRQEGRVATPSSRTYSQPRDRTCISYISCIGRQILHHWRHLGSLCWVHRLPFVYPAIHPWMDILVCFHLLPLTNNDNGVRVHMFYSGLSFFLGMYWGVTWLGHVVTLRSAAEKLSCCLPKLPKHLTFHQLQVRIPVFLPPTQCLFLALISFHHPSKCRSWKF